MFVSKSKKTLHQALAAAAGVALLVGATACDSNEGGEENSTPGASEEFPESGSGVVNIFNFTNYINPDVLEKFTEETGIKVNVDTFSSAEEMVAKVKTGSATYDVVTVSDYVAEDLIESGHLQELDTPSFPNGSNIEEEFIDVYFDEGRTYTAPYAMIYEAIGLNTSVVTEPIESWADYFDAPPSAHGKIGMHDSQTLIINAALLASGNEVCSTDGAAYQDAFDLMEGLKPHLKIISSDGTIDRLAGEETVLSSMWNGSFSRAQAQNPDLQYVFPEEGYTYGGDNFAILSNAQNTDNGKIFINWMLDPENAALNADYIKYSAPIKGITEFLEDTPGELGSVIVPDADTLERGIPDVPCAPAEKEKYDKLWTLFKG